MDVSAAPPLDSWENRDHRRPEETDVEITTRPLTANVARTSSIASKHGAGKSHAPRPPAVVVKRKVKKRKTNEVNSGPCAWIVKHQIGLSTTLLLALGLVHFAIPSARPHTRKFFDLSHYNPTSGQYNRGWDDVYFVGFWIVLFTGLRAAAMDYVLGPIAHRMGINKDKEIVRFAEQAWIFIYYVIFWSLGMHLWYDSDYWLNAAQMWKGFPLLEMDGLLKWYYLVQFAFWIQQIVVVNIEERRKDYHQMFTHHIVTCSLIAGSYSYYNMRVGNVILCLMDVVDFILPAAKMLKYLQHHTLCDLTFVIFMITWFIGRHVMYPMVCWSIAFDVPRHMPYGCYSSQTGQLLSPLSTPSSPSPFSAAQENGFLNNIFQPFVNPDGPVCFNPKIKWTFLALLLFLQVMALVWFGMIIGVAVRVLRGGSAEDSRSDDEGEAEIDEEEASIQYADGKKTISTKTAMDGLPVTDEKGHDRMPAGSMVSAASHTHEQPLLEQEVGVEDLHFRGRRYGSSSTSSASNIARLGTKSSSSSSSIVSSSANTPSLSASSSSSSSSSGASSSGVTLPAAVGGHSLDRKELLGRIGCDKTS
ncbi:LAG1-domain-containing protein [Xylona heveae TC161]|uniref:LAG1-domain-containing protein n=1 Tax=Xylona heveae (strain CBS 132557 / TC161) TaxID=1328760 RepID=A0A165H4I1_XYLHT|nr:LAG1-domain-containing protein [Xylona heveae TC161]KZF22973.1 LAG1-domain-containing protein [Xylona heveae TC161]